MFTRIGKICRAAISWLAHRPGYVFLMADEQRLAGELPQRFAGAWAPLFVLSVIWGLAFMGIWAAAWALFGEPLGRLLPAVAVVCLFVLWPFRRALAATVELLFPSDPTARATAAAAFVVLMTLAMLSLQPDFYRPEASLPWPVAYLRPWPKIYRVLILMPMWGTWSMLITAQFCRPAGEDSSAAAVFARGCRPLAAAAVMGLLLGMTITYFNFLPWEQLTISAVTILAAIASGLIFCRLTGGLTRRALLAANLTTLLIFVLTYLAVRNVLGW